MKSGGCAAAVHRIRAGIPRFDPRNPRDGRQGGSRWSGEFGVKRRRILFRRAAAF